MNLCIIPARGGSKRIPKKNIKEFCGKPLIAYSIEVAKDSKLFDEIIVSTDSKEIATIAKELGTQVQMRPDELSNDFCGTWDVINYVIKTYEKEHEQKVEYSCTIYATAPFLQEKYLKEGFERLKNSDACRSFSVTTMPFPIQRSFKVVEDRCEMFAPENYDKRSQDLEEAYQDAGQFYWEKRGCKSNDVFFGKNSIPIILPRHLVQDIDTMEDFIRAEYMYRAIFPNKFDNWNGLKQKIQKNRQILKFRERDIFFISIGQNIGYETYGKGDFFLRPILVLKKLTKETFVGIPLTSKTKSGSFYFSFSYKKDIVSTAVLSQIRIFDIKRAKYFSGQIKIRDYKNLKTELNKILEITPNPKDRGAGKLQKEDTNNMSPLYQKNGEKSIVLFRVDFGNSIGLGHLKRSLVYAKNFDEVIYISKSDKKEFVPYTLVTIKNENEFFLHVKELQPKEVIVDNYDFTCKEEKEFKKLFPHIKLSVFDDDYREHCCDEIINHNLSADKTKYPNPNIIKIIPPLIRDEFKREKTVKREKIYDYFIAMGGSDTQNLNIPILKSLPKDKKIAVLTTTTNKNLKELKEFVANKENIALHVNSNKVAKLLNQSKLAIITPSVIVHEVLFMGVPFVAIKVADNQDDIYRYLQKKKHKAYNNLKKWIESKQ